MVALYSRVTTQAKAIFGVDIVKAPYQDMTYYLEGLGKGGEAGNNIESQDGCEVYVELTNGKKFKIWASEWGGVTAI